jgi:hypothetical protein
MTLYRRNNSQLVQLPMTRTDLEFGDTSRAPFASAVNLSIAAFFTRSMNDIRRHDRACECFEFKQPQRRRTACQRSLPKTALKSFTRTGGKGQPIVFSHGWPLSADDWDAQMLFFLKHGYG